MRGNFSDGYGERGRHREVSFTEWVKKHWRVPRWSFF